MRDYKENMILCCEEPTYRSVSDLLYTVKDEIAMLGRYILDNMWFGKPLAEVVESKILKLQVFHDQLTKIRQALRYQGVLCLSCDQVHKLCEGIRRTLTRRCDGNEAMGLTMDESNRIAWSVKNPICIGYEDWEEAMYMIAKKIGFDLVRVDKGDACKISFALTKKSIGCEVFAEVTKMAKDCVIKYDILADEKSCNIKYAGILTKKECKIKYKELVKASNCKIEFHNYANILNCGVSADLVKKVYDCGLSLGFSKTEGCPILVTSGGEEFSFSSFQVQNEDQLWSRLRDLNIV